MTCWETNKGELLELGVYCKENVVTKNIRTGCGSEEPSWNHTNCGCTHTLPGARTHSHWQLWVVILDITESSGIHGHPSPQGADGHWGQQITIFQSWWIPKFPFLVGCTCVTSNSRVASKACDCCCKLTTFCLGHCYTFEIIASYNSCLELKYGVIKKMTVSLFLRKLSRAWNAKWTFQLNPEASKKQAEGACPLNSLLWCHLPFSKVGCSLQHTYIPLSHNTTPMIAQYSDWGEVEVHWQW